MTKAKTKVTKVTKKNYQWGKLLSGAAVPKPNKTKPFYKGL